MHRSHVHSTHAHTHNTQAQIGDKLADMEVGATLSEKERAQKGADRLRTIEEKVWEQTRE